ncbi:Lethal(2) giant larvae SRO7 [Beauveria bassiana]|uniref:Lethal(2) giant larvae SRO7 n=1 Tax=Beauveria bassiana TaxID=176275 RepID=A0A2N6NT85_BEABA|nr:Lethal(2) giant larvae SRO7 [Beauveria bassiana]
MAGFLRGKQAGIQKDLSASIRPELFTPDTQARYGINSQISCFAYDPIQSLLAIGTSESKFGVGKIYIFGQRRVQKALQPPRATSFRTLHFSANHIVSLDTKNEIGLWDLDTGTRVGAQVVAGSVAALVVDPMLDWAFIGLQNGDVMAYDLDRHSLSRSFRLPNFWKDREPGARAVTLVCIAMHPRDVGKLLIGYTHGAVVYSFKQNKPVQYFEYVVPRGAPGGTGAGIDTIRKPRLTHALWHPSGTFILTAHDDGSLVFWDLKDSKIVLARTLTATGIELPSTGPAQPTLLEPYIKIAWCCKENCDDSGLLIAGGHPSTSRENSLTFIDLGMTPVYATSSWQSLANYFHGKHSISLALPPGAQSVDFLLIPRSSPHFHGAQDPIAVLSLLSAGELLTLSFPSGYPISPTNQLHPSTFFVHPFITKIHVSSLERPIWLSMVEKRDQGEPILKGGAEGARPRKRFEERTIIQAAHADSIIRIWDSGHADDIENAQPIQVDIARSELGFLTIIDLRGPQIIYQAPMTDFAKQAKRGSLFKGSHSRSDSAPQKEWPVVMEFGVMTLDDDKYSSICCFVGTNIGKIITFKLLPAANGKYSVQLAGVLALDSRVISLNAIDVNTGRPAAATGQTVAGLREGRQVDGAVVAVTHTEIRIFHPANSKGASKEFDNLLCDAASVAELELQGYAIVAVFGDRTARAFSIPTLKEIGRADLPTVDPTRIAETVVTQTGDIFAWTGPSELEVIHVWGTGKGLEDSPDVLINPKLVCPPRPTISNMQWISGTQYVSVLDLDILVGGPDRPQSKRMLEAAAAEQRAARQGGAPGSSVAGTAQEGWGSYLSRQLAERTEKLNIMGDSMDNLQAQSQGWADDVNKFMGKQKRGLVVGALKSKFF